MSLAIALALIAAMVVWLAIQPPGSPHHSAIERDTEELLASLSDPRARRDLLAEARGRSTFMGDFLARYPILNRITFTWKPALVSSMVRASLAFATLPLLGATLLVGIAAGLLKRHHLREAAGYHSSTFSYAGKVFLAFTLAGYVWTGLAPIGPPIWCLYLFSIGGAGGLTAYFGNLPPRL